ncbi:MAG: thioredoxin [Myxococcales bacterium]|nr:thioredoxin [Myxococcales bacterium]MCB9645850.1 thioredoxin [Deltaproteobacteria bacterium]
MASDKLHMFDDGTFESEVLKSSVPVLVDFWAPWCTPCKMIAPSVEALAQEYAGQVKVGKLNIDNSPMVAQRYRVMSIPTLLVFKDGQPVDQIIGAVGKDQIAAMLDRAL